MGLYPFAAQTCQYSSPKSATLDSCRLKIRAALKQTILEITALQVGIGSSDTNEPYFLRLPSLNLSNHLEWRDLSQEAPDAYNVTLIKALEGEHTIDWQDVSTKPSWKLVVFQGSVPGPDSGLTFDLLFEAHHSIADGRSLSVFHERFASILNRLSEDPEQTEDLVTLPSSSTLTPPLESLMSFDISKAYLFKTLWGEFAPTWLRGQPAAPPWAGAPISLAKRPTHIRLVTLPADSVTQLLESCRARKTTITPLMSALIATSLAKRLPEKDTLGGLIPLTVIALRPFADKSKIPDGIELKDAMGDVVTGLSHNVSSSNVSELRSLGNAESTAAEDREAPIWTLTAKIGAEIKQRLATLPRDDITGLLQWVSDWFKRAQDQEGKSRGDTFELSNIGVISPVPDAKWILRRSIFSQSVSAFGPALSVNVSSVAGGPMTMTLIWGDGIVSAELMNGLAADLDQWLNNLSSGEFGVGTA